MSSVTSCRECPNCGETACTHYESRCVPCSDRGVYGVSREWEHGCQCGYHCTVRDELRFDGQWYTVETTVTPHGEFIDLEKLEQDAINRGHARFRECVVMLCKDGTMVPVDQQTYMPLYRKAEDGTLVPRREIIAISEGLSDLIEDAALSKYLFDSEQSGDDPPPLSKWLRLPAKSDTGDVKYTNLRMLSDMRLHRSLEEAAVAVESPDSVAHFCQYKTQLALDEIEVGRIDRKAATMLQERKAALHSQLANAATDGGRDDHEANK